MKTYKVGYLVGSLAKGSINRLLAKALTHLAPPGLELAEIPIRDLPLYSYDYDADYPPVARAFKQAIAEVDAVLFVTPEYNRSIPGALKNAIDWVSRMKEQPFKEKPVAIQSCSQGPLGGSRMQYHMRMSLTYLNAFTFGTPEVIVSTAQNKFDKDMKLTDETTRNFVKQQLAGFAKFIERVRA
jgi:chromate reductase, NAD(P)H dehydrogenase (quinone)